MNYTPAEFERPKFAFNEGVFRSSNTRWVGRANPSALDVRNADIAFIRRQEAIALARLHAALRANPLTRSHGTFAKLTSNRDLAAEGHQIWRTLDRAERSARGSSASTANSALKGTAKPTRPDTTWRKGRVSKDMAKKLEWVPGRSESQSAVGLSKKANEAKYWVIQEVGTGNTATMRHGRPKRAQAGRPRKDVADPKYVIPSQRGRMIKYGLQFGDSPNGNYFTPGSATGQNLQRLRGLQIRPEDRAGVFPIQIHREIPAKKMVRTSGKAGFREYRRLVLAASRGAFPATK